MRDVWYPARLLGGWVLFVAGLVTLPLPVPVGLLLIFLGLGLLARDSRLLRLKIVRLGRRYPRSRDKALGLASSLSRSLGRSLHQILGRRPRP
jgi:hypothetical protein